MGLDPATRRRVRRTAIIFGCIAAALYLGYIGMAVFTAESGAHHSAAHPAAGAPR